jgi:hypothetical protein
VDVLIHRPIDSAIPEVLVSPAARAGRQLSAAPSQRRNAASLPQPQRCPKRESLTRQPVKFGRIDDDNSDVRADGRPAQGHKL